jgi:hypothetical protein
VTTDGVLYVAVGERHLRVATTSARSVRRAMPEVPIALVSDVESAPEPFTHLVAAAGGDGYRAKITGMAASPFGRTVLLDADTWVARSLAPVFELLDRFDMALAHAPNRVTLPLDDVPESFPEYNTGVVAWRAGEATTRLLAEWLHEYDRLVASAPPSKDQPAFRRVAWASPDVRIATLTPEYNQRFQMAGYLNQPVTVLHGWVDEPTFQRIAGLMHGAVDGWDTNVVFADGELIDREGARLGRWT